jgi:hypothetical protein
MRLFYLDITATGGPKEIAWGAPVKPSYSFSDKLFDKPKIINFVANNIKSVERNLSEYETVKSSVCEKIRDVIEIMRIRNRQPVTQIEANDIFKGVLLNNYEEIEINSDRYPTEEVINKHAQAIIDEFMKA